ncbi:hypothetical protein DNTS_020837 [Danionella cerebrum]|uniref:Uncharacterized protein n=1 Tax=Danionella cerebrum TaxID=2873325 RepID=A0A553RBI9_9TELE|nr:hypothetical protein DNTS_020837 [Danionella translucida]
MAHLYEVVHFNLSDLIFCFYSLFLELHYLLFMLSFFMVFCHLNNIIEWKVCIYMCVCVI